jgi:hypothetical protein
VFQLSDRVSIVGGVLQEYGVRLDGLTGIITSSRHDAPPGTFAVYVYWEESLYHDRISELPKWVNVPPEFLCKTEDGSTPATDAAPQKTPSKKDKPRGGLRLVD